MLDIEQDLSRVLDGHGSQVRAEGSGLTHEQETTLTYFAEPSSIQDVLQISRYDELDTSKLVADLLEMGLLEISDVVQGQRTPIWNQPREKEREAAASGPSAWFWPAVVVLLAGPLIAYVPQARSSLNQGLASLQRSDVHVATDSATRERQAWAFRMAAPGEAVALARSLGVDLEQGRKSIPDFTQYDLRSTAEQERVRISIERAIRQFEPRLTRVKVIPQTPDNVAPALRFHIEAKLRDEDDIDDVEFDATVIRESRRISVTGGS